MRTTTLLVETRQTVSESSADARAKSARDWAGEITDIVTRGRRGARDLANLVYEARRKLHRGQWTELWRSRRLPFSKRKGEMLAAIGKELGRLDAQTFARLPAGWSVLYELSVLSRETLLSHIRHGKVHPALTLAEARALVAAFKGRRPRDNSSQSKVRQRLRKFLAFVHETSANWSVADRNFARIEFGRLLEGIRSNPNTANKVGRQTPNAQTFAHFQSQF